jgi:hypothetical protein
MLGTSIHLVNLKPPEQKIDRHGAVITIQFPMIIRKICMCFHLKANNELQKLTIMHILINIVVKILYVCNLCVFEYFDFIVLSAF